MKRVKPYPFCCNISDVEAKEWQDFQNARHELNYVLHAFCTFKFPQTEKKWNSEINKD